MFAIFEKPEKDESSIEFAARFDDLWESVKDLNVKGKVRHLLLITDWVHMMEKYDCSVQFFDRTSFNNKADKEFLSSAIGYMSKGLGQNVV